MLKFSNYSSQARFNEFTKLSQPRNQIPTKRVLGSAFHDIYKCGINSFKVSEFLDQLLSELKKKVLSVLPKHTSF